MTLNPLQRNKVDLNSLNPEERKLFEKYGKLPAKKKTLLDGATRDRKFFDSGDYAMAKAGKTTGHSVGTTVPSPDNIPHSSPQVVPQTLPPASSPTLASSPPGSASGSGSSSGSAASVSAIPLMSLAGSPPLEGSAASIPSRMATSPVKESRLASQLQLEADSPQRGGAVEAETGDLSARA